jgi:peroxiredoxin Q/BCP
MAEKIGAGDVAPDFELLSQKGEKVRLSAFRGSKPVVLFFYPRANSAGCTAEVCAFRDSYEVFTDAGAEVIGISSDAVSAQEHFAGKHSLPFLLVSDEGGQVREAYGVPNSMGKLLPGRATYVIDKEGVVRHVFNSQMNINGHVKTAVKVIGELAQLT